MRRLVQLQNGPVRRVAAVEEPRLRLLAAEWPSAHALASAAVAKAGSFSELAAAAATGESLDYDAIYRGDSPWKLLPAWDHPEEPARCLVSGTGLTHLGSAKDRNAMHAASKTASSPASPLPSAPGETGTPPAASPPAAPAAPPAAEMTDSMKMFQWGVERGRPAPGAIGVAPEWFYKGCGTILRAHGEPLDAPDFAEDGGEEAEIAGCYLIGPDGRPWRAGFAIGNEFSDHVFEKKNYLNLAGSKIRPCALGPELVVGADFARVPGRVRIERAGRELWAKDIATGAEEMSHSLQNIEHHQFKFPAHRRPGDAHVHYFGAHSLSFGAGVRLADGDVMEVAFAGFGRALRNPLRVAPPSARAVEVSPLR